MIEHLDRESLELMVENNIDPYTVNKVYDTFQRKYFAKHKHEYHQCNTVDKMDFFYLERQQVFKRFVQRYVLGDSS